ncbi:MAG TPA: hypothetical protein EYP10_05905 [Armatimonadetes bacterium]|nr:hypothetical protein [Armatimonadota bacterium]
MNVLGETFAVTHRVMDAPNGGKQLAFKCQSQRKGIPSLEATIDVNGDEVKITTQLMDVTAQVRMLLIAKPAWQDALLCRIAPDSADVVQMALGRIESLRCNSLFEPHRDCAVTIASDGDAIFKLTDDGCYAINVHNTIGAEPSTLLRVHITERLYREHHGIPHFTPIDKGSHPLPPSGWCSWYYYYQDINEDEIVKNAQWMAENLKPYGAVYVQVDDGWQGVGHGGGENRDWETVDKRFPHGMKWLADQIHALGMKAGIWLIPQTQSDEKLVRENEHLFMLNQDGTSVSSGVDPYTGEEWVAWEGAFILDTSTEDGCKYLRQLFHRLAREWGYDYFKIDGQPAIQMRYERHRHLLKNQRVTPDEAYRMGLRAIRHAIGNERYLLGCYNVALWGIGIVDGARTGADIRADWNGFQPALRATCEFYFLHNIAWYCDPDVICVREPLTLNQARVWASLYGLTGQALMASDKMYELPDERVELLRRIFPATDIRPVDLYPYSPDEPPRIWDLRIRKGNMQWDVVGIFNFREEATTITLRIDALGLPTDVAYHAYDFWGKRYLGIVREQLEIGLDPTSCKVIALHQMLDHPQVITTSRHITQGWLDLDDVRWDAQKLTLSGKSTVVPNEEYIIGIGFPHDGSKYSVVDAAASDLDVTIHAEEHFVAMTFTAREGRTVDWYIRFTRE